MTKPKRCPPAPGPLEGYAARFDDLFTHVAQRRGFREYLAGLLAPRDRNKTLTALAGAEPVTGAQHPAVQRLQFFLSESRWDPGRVNARRLELLAADPATAPHGSGVLVIDDSGDRKDGTKTAHVGHQWLGRYGKTDNGVVTVTTVWADERLYYPVHAVPYTPARHFARGKNDPAFRTKLQIGADLAAQAQAAGFAFRAVAADSAYGDQDGFRGELRQAGLPGDGRDQQPGGGVEQEGVRHLVGLVRAAHSGDGEGRGEQAPGEPEPGPRGIGQAEAGQGSEDGLVRGVGDSAGPAGLVDEVGPVAQRVVRGEGEPGAGARGEGQPGAGRAAQVAAQQEEQHEDRGGEFERGRDADPDPARPPARWGQAIKTDQRHEQRIDLPVGQRGADGFEQQRGGHRPRQQPPHPACLAFGSGGEAPQ